MRKPSPSPDNDQLKAAEQRGYSRGYSSGRKRGEIDGRRKVVLNEQQEFLDRAFLAALPAAMNAQGWRRGDNEIRSIDESVAMAADFARAALKLRPWT